MSKDLVTLIKEARQENLLKLKKNYYTESFLKKQAPVFFTGVFLKLIY